MKSNIISSIILFSMVWGKVDYKYLFLMVIYIGISNYLNYIHYENNIKNINETKDRYQKKLHDYMKKDYARLLEYKEWSSSSWSVGFTYKCDNINRYFHYASIIKINEDWYEVKCDYLNKYHNDRKYKSLEEAKYLLEENFKLFISEERK